MTQSVSEAGPGTPETVELLVIAAKYNAVRCRRLTDGSIVTFRPAGGVRDEAEGQILTVVPIKEWSYMRGHYLSGRVVAVRVDMAEVAARFGLPPLVLYPAGIWDPLQEHWLAVNVDEILAEEGEVADLDEVLAEEDAAEDDVLEVEVPVVGETVHPNGDPRREAAGGDVGQNEDRGREQRLREAVREALLRHPAVSPWEREIILAGPRPAYEMEQVVPGANWEEMIDPISDSVELKEAGDWRGSRGSCSTGAWRPTCVAWMPTPTLATCTSAKGSGRARWSGRSIPTSPESRWGISRWGLTSAASCPGA